MSWGLRTDEVRLHSALIAELLNPKGSHGSSFHFLQAFLEQLGIEEGYFDYARCSIDMVERVIGPVTETEGGRIDIIIEDGTHAIIIENKIDSNEGLNKKQVQTGCDIYDKSLQTSRYYVATKRKNPKTLKQLYVYLTPSLNNECECANFIKITYQDIIDGIIVPMLSTTSLSSRARFFLEELKTELTFPSLEGRNVKSSIAISNENSERFNKIWKRHGNLIIDAAIATSESDIWYIRDGQNCAYYDHAPRKELLDRLPPENKSLLRKNPHYETVQREVEKVNDLDLKSDLYKIDGDEDLLKMFWENNKRFLLALMNGLPEDERKKIECLSKTNGSF
jgi:hypothetical protein